MTKCDAGKFLVARFGGPATRGHGAPKAASAEKPEWASVLVAPARRILPVRQCDHSVSIVGLGAADWT